MKKHIVWVALLIFQWATAQKSNQFLDRDFWKTSPSVEVVKKLIAEGNDPAELNRFMIDATVYAILENAPNETIEYLLSLPGNEVDKVTHDGRNYLLWAGYEGNLPLVKSLIQKGSNVNLVDEHGLNLVMFTAIGGQTNPELYELYEKNGLSVTEKGKDGSTVLLALAPHVKDIKELDYFLQKGLKLEAQDNEGNNIFYYGAQGGNTHFLDQLIQAGIPYDALNQDDENAFFAAALGRRRNPNSIGVFDYLIKLGLNPKQTSKEGKNMLHYLAINNTQPDIYELMISKGVNPSQVDKKGRTPFLIAMAYGNEKTAQILLPYVKDVNLLDESHKSALSYAFAHADQAMVEQLLKKGADLNVTDKNGETLVNEIVEHYSPRNKDFFAYANALLLKNKVKAGVNSVSGNTIYHTIAFNGTPELLDEVKAYGVDLNQLNAQGLSPLLLAAMKATDLKTLKALVNAGADRRLVTEFGEDAYILASENEMINEDLNQLKFLKP